MKERFIGTKVIYAVEMTRGEYNIYQGWTLPADQDPLDRGYMVEYTDGGKPNHPAHTGYISWTPEEQFNNAYRKIGRMTFGMALEALKVGQAVARTGWNGQGMFVYRVPAASYPPQTPIARSFTEPGELVRYNAYLALKTTHGSVSMWAPSGNDALAEDWFIVEL